MIQDDVDLLCRSRGRSDKKAAAFPALATHVHLLPVTSHLSNIYPIWLQEIKIKHMPHNSPLCRTAHPVLAAPIERCVDGYSSKCSFTLRERREASFAPTQGRKASVWQGRSGQTWSSANPASLHNNTHCSTAELSSPHTGRTRRISNELAEVTSR